MLRIWSKSIGNSLRYSLLKREDKNVFGNGLCADEVRLILPTTRHRTASLHRSERIEQMRPDAGIKLVYLLIYSMSLLSVHSVLT